MTYFYMCFKVPSIDNVNFIFRSVLTDTTAIKKLIVVQSLGWILFNNSNPREAIYLYGSIRGAGIEPTPYQWLEVVGELFLTTKCSDYL